jgi:hypothetical protein
VQESNGFFDPPGGFRIIAFTSPTMPVQAASIRGDA